MLYPEKGLNYLDILVTYCDINNIVLQENHYQLIDIIIAKTYNSIITFHKLGFLWHYFNQFVRGEITLEQFMTMGDIEGQIEDQINPHIYTQEHPALLTTLSSEIINTRDNRTIVIIAPLIEKYYTYHQGKINTHATIFILDN